MSEDATIMDELTREEKMRNLKDHYAKTLDFYAEGPTSDFKNGAMYAFQMFIADLEELLKTKE